jgi:NADH-quinone oxidoreductase subunit J
VANLLFYVMAAATTVAALGVVLAKNPIASILSLLAAFFGLATIYLLAGFQFIAAAQILVYAGAIMVLFLFVIMLLNLGDERTLHPLELSIFRGRSLAMVLVVAIGLFMASVVAIAKQGVRPVGTATPEHGFDDVNALAEAMFGRYLIPFEAVSLLLLATAVAVVVLAKRDRAPRIGRDKELANAARARATESEEREKVLS